MIKTDYDAIADAYSRTRRVSEHVIAELQSFCSITPASRVLEVGCGTAKHIHALVDCVNCAGFGVEPSAGMRRHALVHDRLNVCRGSADCIPFEDAFFDLLFSVNVIHHLPRPGRYFEESFRVLRPGGWICTFTDSTEMIRRREPLSRYWPSSAEVDIARYPTVAELLDAMNQVGYSNLTAREIKKTLLTADVAPYRERAFSCLQLIDDLQFEKGLRLLEEDLHKGPVLMTSEYVCIWGEA
jgi:SAM-dependent methyltransferase